ncbi:MAG: hypothetical protein WCJ72_11620, partial [Chryseobacterium sp.]
LSMAVLGIVLGYIFIKTRALEYSLQGDLLVIILGLVFAIYVLQLFAHRLKNAGMSPWLTFLLFTPFLATVTDLSFSDQKLVLALSCIPILSVFMIAMLLPTHRYKL